MQGALSASTVTGEPTCRRSCPSTEQRRGRRCSRWAMTTSARRPPGRRMPPLSSQAPRAARAACCPTAADPRQDSRRGTCKRSMRSSAMTAAGVDADLNCACCLRSQLEQPPERSGCCDRHDQGSTQHAWLVRNVIFLFALCVSWKAMHLCLAKRSPEEGSCAHLMAWDLMGSDALQSACL